MMTRKNLLKSAVAGTTDYHALMQSVVFTIIPQTFQHAQVGNDFGEFKIFKVEKELELAWIAGNSLIETTHVYLNCCWDCRTNYRDALCVCLGIHPWTLEVYFYILDYAVRFPPLSPMIQILVSWQCPFCGTIEAYDDVPF